MKFFITVSHFNFFTHHSTTGLNYNNTPTNYNTPLQITTPPYILQQYHPQITTILPRNFKNTPQKFQKYSPETSTILPRNFNNTHYKLQQLPNNTPPQITTKPSTNYNKTPHKYVFERSFLAQNFIYIMDEYNIHYNHLLFHPK